MKKYLIILTICLSCFTASYSQSNNGKPEEAQNIQQKQPSNEIVLEYQKHLLEETKAHREFTASYYNNLLWLLGGGFALIVIVITFFSSQSIKGIKEQVNELFKNSIGNILDNKLEEINQKVNSIDSIITENRKRFEEQDSILKNKLLQLENQYKQGNRFLLLVSLKNCNPSLPHRIINNLEKFLPNKSILWVDDNPQYNEHPRTILSSEEVKFIIATSSDDAYLHLENSKVDLVISDMSRDADKEAGISFMKALRSKNNTIPFILYTSDDNVKKYLSKIKIKDSPNFITAGVDNLLNHVVEILSHETRL